MNQNSLIAACLLSLAVGGGIGYVLGGSSDSSPSESDPQANTDTKTESTEKKQKKANETRSDAKASKALKDAKAEITRLKGQLSTAKKSDETQAEEAKGLQSELAATKNELGKYTSNKLIQSMIADKSKIEGVYKAIDALNPDWKKLGGSARVLQLALVEYVNAIKSGEKPDADVISRVQGNNQPLAAFAIKAMAHMPSQSKQVNAGFSHPIFAVELMRNVLEQSEDPFTNVQEEALAKAGQDYLDSYSSTFEKMKESATQMERSAAEYRLRLKFSQFIRERIISNSQKAILWQPDTKGLQSVDIYSPALFYSGQVVPMDCSNEEVFKATMLQVLKTHWRLTEEDIEAVSASVETFMATAKSEAKSVESRDFGFWTETEVLEGLKASLAMQAEIMGDASISEAIRKKVAEAVTILLPQRRKE